MSHAVQQVFSDRNGDEICTSENKSYLNEQIITYIGNKRSLLSFIGKSIDIVKNKLNKKKLICCDLFSGSGIVSRYLKAHSSCLYSNDLELYSTYINKYYLSNNSDVNMIYLHEVLQELHKNINNNFNEGFITDLYSPHDDLCIQKDERVFYTHRNAMYIDTARQEIEKIDDKIKHFFIAPLLYSASVHNNTSGVFKGYYKNKLGIGQFGGEGRNALSRILGNIELMLPIFSNYECEYHVFQKESSDLVHVLNDLDFCYMDPPYNQHPYGSNYFMLNLISEYKKPKDISSVSGIPVDWNRSDYNKAPLAKDKLFSVIENCPAKFILISYNSEGFVKFDEFEKFLHKIGNLMIFDTEYNTFRGCRNLYKRNIKVKEYLFLLERR